ncbi:YfcC family protein [Jeotgalibacillus sp. S-D1]|nr:YfcC family protein [Jeotgalibacillus sp. S-D1]
MPHVYVILFIFIVLASLLTYIVPAGEYERIPGPEGRTTIDPASYQTVESNPAGITDFMVAIPNGLAGAAEVVFFTLIIGGMFMVLRKTGMIEWGVSALTRRFSSKSMAVIPVLMVVFSVVCSLIGTQELSLVYIPVILPLLIALRFDSVTAVGVALVATTAGFTTGVLNPINTGLGQQLAEIPVYSGIGLRAVALILIMTTGILYVVRYARKVRQNPKLSLVYEEDAEKRKLYRKTDDAKPFQVTKRQKIAAAVTGLFFGVLIYGVLFEGWFMLEMSGLFILMGITAGLIAGLNTSQICEGFNQGFRDVLVGAIIVGIARAVAVVMEDGQIMDTIVYGLGIFVGNFPPVFSAAGMFFTQLLFNFVVPSGSGQALVTMPIMAPLADLLNMTRQTAVLAFQLGDGLGNILFPTSGYFMAALALAGVSWGKWVKFYLPLFGIWTVISIGLLVFAQLTGWS